MEESAARPAQESALDQTNEERIPNKIKISPAKIKIKKSSQGSDKNLVTLKASGSAIDKQNSIDRSEEQKLHSNYRIFKSMRNKLSNEIENMKHVNELKRYSENSPIYDNTTIPDDINNYLSVDASLQNKSLNNKYKKNVNISNTIL